LCIFCPLFYGKLWILQYFKCAYASTSHVSVRALNLTIEMFSNGILLVNDCKLGWRFAKKYWSTPSYMFLRLGYSFNHVSRFKIVLEILRGYEMQESFRLINIYYRPTEKHFLIRLRCVCLTVATCCKVTYPFSSFHPRVVEFSLEPVPLNCQRTSPSFSTYCPLCSGFDENTIEVTEYIFLIRIFHGLNYWVNT